MSWLLTILLTWPDGRQIETETGLMATPEICQLAGNAIGARIAAESPEIEMFFTCEMEL